MKSAPRSVTFNWLVTHRPRALGLAAALLAGAAAGGVQAQTAVTVGPVNAEVYGLLDIGLTYTDKVLATGASAPRNTLTVHPGAMQASRLGFRGALDMPAAALKALWVLEAGVNPDNGTYGQGGIPFGRRAVVGLEGGFGTVFVGRQTDFLDDMGTLSSTIDFGAQAATIHSLDRTYADRTNNSVRWNSPRWAGVRGIAMLGLGENNGISAGMARGLGLDYEQGGLRLASGYYDSRLGSTAANASQANIGATSGAAGDMALRTWTLGAAYPWGPARIHATYSDVRQPLAAASATATRSLRSASNDKTRITDLGVSWALTGSTNLNASVIEDRVSFVGAESGTVRQLNLGVDHYLAKTADVYALVGQQRASRMLTPGMGEGAPGADRSQLLMRVGIRYKF